jgi:hypothetical protein
VNFTFFPGNKITRENLLLDPYNRICGVFLPRYTDDTLTAIIHDVNFAWDKASVLVDRATKLHSIAVA